MRLWASAGRLARSLLGLTLLLAGCGDLPRPFEGHPGRTAARLAQPPPARLAVPAPTAALLSGQASAQFATALVDALVAQEVPAVAHASGPGDWRLVIGAELQGGVVLPAFTVQDAKGAPQGSVQGAPVPAAAWAAGDAATLAASAAQAGPRIADLLTSIDAKRKASDPNSLFNRPAHVAVIDVTGAPGDGDSALTRQMRLEIPRLGEQVQDAPEGADFVVAGQVHTAPAAEGNTRVEIQWVVTDASKRELGRIVQLNDVPPDSVSGYWGDIAVVVAQEAASGVKSVILKQTGGRTPGAAPGTTPAGVPPTLPPLDGTIVLPKPQKSG